MMKPILKIVTEWTNVISNAGSIPSVDLVRACICKQFVDAGCQHRISELDRLYPSEDAKIRRAVIELLEKYPTDIQS